jgi:hypothetical protein
MGRGRPVTEAEKRKIRVLHGKGWSAGKIAKELGRPVSTVTRCASQMDLHFDHAQTQAATQAAAIDMRARRARIAERLLREAEGHLDDQHRPYLAYAFANGGDPDTRFSQHAVMPQPADKAQLMRAATSALAEHRRLAEFDTGDEGAVQARSMLGKLFEGLAEAVGTETPQGDG